MRIPSAGTPVSGLDLLRGFLSRKGPDDFKTCLQEFFGVNWCGLTGSGTSALYAILKVLQKHSERREVILPAYTAPSLILPIRKAGLHPVLCDVSPDTLNSGPTEILSRVNNKTLAAMPVHMFGLPTDAPAIKTQINSEEIFTIEDAASAMGSTWNGRPVGVGGDIGFYSFNRGKNLSTYSGGAMVTSREDLIPNLEATIGEFPFPDSSTLRQIKLFSVALSIVVRPLGYTVLERFAARYKYTEIHTDFHVRAYTPFQARMGIALMSKFPDFSKKRADNGQFLHDALLRIDCVQPAAAQPGSVPSYNQFPVLLADESTRDRVHQAILESGLEATLLYPSPIHRIYSEFWDGSGPDPFPQATAIASRLLLIPTHPLVPRSALEKAVECIEKSLN